MGKDLPLCVWANSRNNDGSENSENSGSSDTSPNGSALPTLSGIESVLRALL